MNEAIPANPDVKRVYPRYIRRTPRTIASDVSAVSTVPGRAFAWCFPWSRATYPGFAGAVRELIGAGWSRSAVWKWRTGARRCPREVAERLHAYIGGRLIEGAAIHRELGEYLATYRERALPARRRAPEGPPAPGNVATGNERAEAPHAVTGGEAAL